MHQLLTTTLDALYLALWLSLPVLSVAFLVSCLVALLQALTQLSEPVLNAIPRALAVGLTLCVCGAWMGDQLTGFTARLFAALPGLAR